MNNEITFEDFLKVEMCVGTIIEAKLNEKAIKPAYALKIDFGELGIKSSSAQITQNHDWDKLLGKQVVAVMNFPSKRVAGVKSEILVLAAVCHEAGTVLLEPTLPVKNGCKIL